MPAHHRRPATGVGVAALALALLGGCGVQIPADPDGTLERVRQTGELRVGVSPNPPFTILPEEGGQDPAGTEVDLVTGFARAAGAEPTWVVGGEESLVRQLEEGELHVVIGGLTVDSPWGDQVGLTRPYATTDEDGEVGEGGEGGEEVGRVMAVVPGENALLSALERFLDGEWP